MDKILIFSFLVTLILLFLFRPLAIKYNCVDTPNFRKNHIGKVPLIGGLAIFFGLLASQIYLNEFDERIIIILTVSLLMLILGVWDDIVDLKAKTKLVCQFILVVLTIHFTDIKIESLGYLFGFPYPLELGFLSLPFTVIAIIGLTNSFNMVDGIDGLAGGLFVVACIGMLSFSINIENSLFTPIFLALISGLVPFLIFNIIQHNKIKVFLGDGGSLFLGFLISMALIYNAETIDIFSPSFALWCVSIPLFDFFSIVILRKIENRSMMIASRDHLHHLLSDYGLSNFVILIFIISKSLIMLLFGYFLEKNLPTFSFLAFILLFSLYLFIKLYLSFKKNKSVNLEI